MDNLFYNGQTADYQDLIDNGYEFKLGDYITGGWNIAKQNIGGFIGFSLLIPVIIIVFYAIMVGIYAVIFIGYNSFPSTSLIFLVSIIAIVFYISLYMGIYMLGYGYFCVADKIQHREYYFFSDFFRAFAHWKQLLYYKLLHTLIMLFTTVPPLIFMATYIYILIFKEEMANYENIKEIMSFLPWIYLLMIPGYYFMISYSFAPLLIIFGKLTYWDAMETSRKIITKKFFWFLLFYIVLGLIMYSGIFALIIGMLFSIPVALCMMYAAYHDIVSKNTSSIDAKIDEIGINDDTTYNWQN